MNGGEGLNPGKGRGLDKRDDYRHSLALDTEVHFEELSIRAMFRCRTKNIGLQGVFLPSNSLPVYNRMNVELVIIAPAESEVGNYCISASVVHSSDMGAGLVFSGLDDQQRREFRRFLLRAKVAARH